MNKELILRLSKYKRLLYKLKALGLERVFSNNLGDAIAVAPSLVRKDFSVLNLPGNKRGGYDIDMLIRKTRRCTRPGQTAGGHRCRLRPYRYCTHAVRRVQK